MQKEDFELMLQVLVDSGKNDDKTNTLKEKLQIIIERNNLDENYNKSMQDLNDRFTKLIQPEENK